MVLEAPNIPARIAGAPIQLGAKWQILYGLTTVETVREMLEDTSVVPTTTPDSL